MTLCAIATSGGASGKPALVPGKSPEAIAKLKNLGFSIIDDKNAKFIVGRIAVEKLATLAEIAEVQYVLPSVK